MKPIISKIAVKTDTITDAAMLREFERVYKIKQLPLVQCYLSFRVEGICAGVGNGIRRAALEEIKWPYLQAGEVATTDKMIMFEYLTERMIQIPIRYIHGTKVRPMLSLYAVNTGATSRIVYASEIKVTGLDEPLFNPTYELTDLQPGYTLEMRNIKLAETTGADHGGVKPCSRAGMFPTELGGPAMRSKITDFDFEFAVQAVSQKRPEDAVMPIVAACRLLIARLSVIAAKVPATMKFEEQKDQSGIFLLLNSEKDCEHLTIMINEGFETDGVVITAAAVAVDEKANTWYTFNTASQTLVIHIKGTGVLALVVKAITAATAVYNEVMAALRAFRADAVKQVTEHEVASEAAAKK